MRNTIIALFLITATLFTSCEEVIEVPLETAAPRLVINASLKWEKGSSGADQQIKLTTTTGYFDAVIPTVSGAEVVVTDEAGNSFPFLETEPGDYRCTNFIPALNKEFKLKITLNGEVYEAVEIMKPVPVIDKIEQEERDGFGGKFIQVKAFYTDNGDTEDYYLFRFSPSHKLVPGFQVSEDEFYQGNQIFGIYLSEDMKANDKIDITLSGISQRYFNYMSKIIAAAGSGGPFQSPGSVIRGNIVNKTNPDNYALGYFAVSESVFATYVIQ